MGIFDKFSRYGDVIKLGLSKEQAQHLDELDGEKDNKYEGKSLFDVISEHKVNYDNGGNKNFLGQEVSFYDYLCGKMLGIKFKLATTFGLDNIDDTPEGIADSLVDAIFQVGTGDIETPIKYIDHSNIIDVLSLYQEKANKKNCIMGVQYDQETLFEAILDENISNEKKKEYLQHLTQKVLIAAMIIDENKYREYEQRLNSAIDNALSKPWPNQSSKEIDSIVKEILNLQKTEYCKDVVKKVEKYTDKLDEEINKEDILGNGKLDNPAKQISTNCRVHAMINGILATDKGKKYLNSLIHKDKSTGNITIYLPGAKNAGLPKPKGDGRYTYTENQILNNINKVGTRQMVGEGLGNIRSKATSIGDGDETALLMAMQDFLTENKGQAKAYHILSDFEDKDYTEALFGKEIKDNFVDSNAVIEKHNFNVSESDITTLEQEIKRLQKSKKQTNEIRSNIAEYTSMFINFSSDNNKKAEYLNDIFTSEQFFIQLSIFGGIDLSDVKQIGTNGNLLSNHAYAIKNIDKESVTLIESNNPKNQITISFDDFFNIFNISIYEYPEDI